MKPDRMEKEGEVLPLVASIATRRCPSQAAAMRNDVSLTYRAPLLERFCLAAAGRLPRTHRPFRPWHSLCDAEAA